MKKHTLVILIIFAAAIAAVSLMPKAVKQGAPGAAQGAAPGAALGVAPGAAAGTSEFSVRTAAIRRGTIQDYIESNGDIVADSTVEVYPYVAGKLVSVRVSLGSRVSKGQLLAELDPSTPGSAYALNQVYAPISGTVTSLPASVGSTVGTSSTVAKIGVLDAEGIQVSARIPERYVGVLKIGLKAAITLQAYGGESFKATVTRVSPIVDSTSRSKEIRLSFDKADERINVGMFAKVRLETVTYRDRLIAAVGAVQADSTGSYVFVVKGDSTVEKRAVATGADVDGAVELVSGVSEGEVVVVEGASVLADGATIKDISTAKAVK